MTPRLIKPPRFGDERGWFSETYNRTRSETIGIVEEFVQDNHSYSAAKYTLRGLHCQLPPHAQSKLVRCVQGAIWDVAVDLRRGSPTFGKWVAAVLSASGGEQLYVPVGFGHGFLTLTENAEVQYKCSDIYAPSSEAGVVWNDADLAIAWPLDGATPTLSDKDQRLPALRDFVGTFEYDGTPLAELEQN